MVQCGEYNGLSAKTASIRPQRLQCSRQAAGLVERLAEVGKATLLIKDLCNDVYFLLPIVTLLQFLQSLLEVLLGFEHISSILPIKLFPDFRAFVLVDILVAPEVEVIIFATPQMHFYRIC